MTATVFDWRRNKVVVFFACLGILGLIAVSLHLAAPAPAGGQRWKNSAYVSGQSAPADAKAVLALLQNVRDPEVNLTVPELGLVYDAKVDKNTVRLLMTLTTPSCPWSSQLLTDIRDALFRHKGVAELNIDITFDPPWTLDRIDQAALARLQAGGGQLNVPAVSAQKAGTP